MFPYKNTLILIVAYVLILSSCGGGSENDGRDGRGGSSGNLQNSSIDSLFEGNRLRAVVSPTNANHMLLSTIEVVDLIEQFVFISLGDIFDRIYLGLPEDEVLDGEPIGQDTVCQSGDASTEDNTNSDGVGVISITFNDCFLGADFIDGVIAIELSTQDNLVDINMNIDGLRLISSADNLDVVINGEIEQSLISPASFFNSITWSGSLIIEHMSSGIQVYARDLVRTGLSWDNYRISGQILHSVFGLVQLDIDTSDSILALSGNGSSLDAQFTPGNYRSEVSGFSVTDYAIALNSDGNSIADQEITLSVQQLLSFSTDQNSTLIIDVLGDTATENGTPTTLTLDVESGSDFFAVDWSVTLEDGDCQPDFTVDGLLQITLALECSGTLLVGAEVSNSLNSELVEVQVFFQRDLPDVQLVSPPESIEEGVQFSVSALENNPEDGPFDYAVAFGPSGTSADGSGVLTWDGSYIPRVSNTLDLNFGLSITNDRSVYQSFSSTLTFENYVDPIESELPLLPRTFYGAVDLEPENTAGDIVFFRQNSGTEVIKYSKSTNDFRTIIEDDPNFSLTLPSNEESTRVLNYVDWNSDQVKDLVAIRRYGFDDSSNRGRNLIVYDMENESVLLDEQIFLSRQSSIGEGEIRDIHFVDIDGDGNKEFVFLLTMRLFLADGSDAAGGIYSYTPGASQPELLLNLTEEDFDLSSGHALVVTDLDKDSNVELILAGTRFNEATKDRLFVFQLENNELVLEHFFGVPIGLPLGFSDLFVEDVDNDNQFEVVAIFQQQSDVLCGPSGSVHTVIYIMDEELQVERQNELVDTIITSISRNNSPGGNVYINARDCSTDQNPKIFAYFNVYWGQTIWKRQVLTNAAWLFPRNSATSFIDAEGRPKLAIGGFLQILITQ